MLLLLLANKENLFTNYKFYHLDFWKLGFNNYLWTFKFNINIVSMFAIKLLSGTPFETEILLLLANKKTYL